jgi:zinc protease
MEGFMENRRARPETVFRDEMTLKMYQGHPRRLPTTKETIGQVDLDVALEVYRDRFSDAGDFTFVIVGNFDPETLRPLVLTYLGGLPATEREESWRDVGANMPDEVVKFSVTKGLESKSRVQITFGGDASWSRQSSHDISSLAGVLRIRLREVLREDMGATYGVSVYGGISRRPTERYGLTVSFGCGPENVDGMLEAVFAEVESIKAGVDDDYIGKVREIQIRQRETSLRENRFWLNVLAGAYRYDTDPRLVLEYDDLVASVSAERIVNAAKLYLDGERYVQGVLYPEEDADSSQP